MVSDRKNPLRDLVALQDRMSRLFEETLGRPAEDPVGGSWAPAADLFETGEELVLNLDLPGVERDRVEVLLNANLLTVKGERPLPEDVQRSQYHRRERPCGEFSRSFTLPAAVDAEGITATHRDGVLTVRLPKQAAARSRKIEIK